MNLYAIDEKTMIEIFSKSILFLYKSNYIIYYQNSPPLNAFLILKGEVCFKKYSNFDLLAMIGGEENIVISKKYYHNKNSKMNKKNMLNLRYNAFNKGQEDINNKNILTCGDFFGEENLMGNTEYDNCAIIKRDSIILTINIDNFNYYLKKRIIKTKENIKELILRRFTFFKQVERKQLKAYMDHIYKIFPKNGDIICKENELSNKLYLIYQGRCAVQKNLGNILFLNKGDLFGYESLIDLPKDYNENIKINILKYEYTIVNKDDSTIILQLDIPFCDKFTTWRIHNNLLKYFKMQKTIISKFEKCKNLAIKLLQDRYHNLDIRKKRKNKSLNKSSDDSNININNREYKIFFNKTIASERNIINNKNYNKRKVNLFFQTFKKFPKNYLNSLLNFSKKKDEAINHQINDKNNNNNIKILINDLQNNSHMKILSNDHAYTTPKKRKKNKSLLTYINLKNVNNIQNEKNSTSIMSFNYINDNNKSKTLRRYSTNSMISMSTFGDSKSLTKYKLLIKNNNNKNKQKAKIKKSQKSYNKIYFRNDSKICSNFDYKKNYTNEEYLPFILSHSRFFTPPITNNKTSRRSRYDSVNMYNYPLIF